MCFGTNRKVRSHIGFAVDGVVRMEILITDLLDATVDMKDRGIQLVYLQDIVQEVTKLVGFLTMKNRQS